MKRIHLATGLLLCAVATFVFSPAAPAGADATIHIPANTTLWGFWGSSRQEFGQTFQAPTANQLDSFSVHSLSSGEEHSFTAFVMEWDGNKAEGPILYKSDPRYLRAQAVQDFTFVTGGVPLVPGQEYVAFFSIYPSQGGNVRYKSENTTVGAAGSGYGPFGADPYPLGSFVFTDGNPSWEMFVNKTWLVSGNMDLAFDAAFSALPVAFSAPHAPEPGSLTLLAIGVLPLLGLLRRRLLLWQSWIGHPLPTS